MEIVNGWEIVGKGSKVSYGRYNVLAKCPSCGEVLDRNKSALRKVSRCKACYLSEVRVDGVATARGRVKRNLVVEQAKKRGLSMTLADEELRVLWGSDCAYCGSPPSNKMKGTGSGVSQTFIYSGIDRVDSSRGYEIDNVVPCCKICNHAKESMSVAEWYLWIDRVYSNLKKDGKL